LAARALGVNQPKARALKRGTSWRGSRYAGRCWCIRPGWCTLSRPGARRG